MHPSAPTEMTGILDAFAQTSQAVIDLTSGLSDEALASPSILPGWTLADIVAHLTSLELLALGRPDRQVDVPPYDHVTSSFSRMMENGVELRRGRPGRAVATEYADVVRERIGRLRAVSDGNALGESPWGPMPMRTLLTVKSVDTWCHEQDLRDTLGRLGNHDSPAACLWVQQVIDTLPDIIARRAGIEVGRVVMIELTGPILGRSGVRVVEDEHGTSTGLPMFSGDSDTTGPLPTLDKVTSIRMASYPFARRAAGRISVDDLPYAVDGDHEVARRVLEALPITP